MILADTVGDRLVRRLESIDELSTEERQAVLNLPMEVRSFSADQITENVAAVLDAVGKAKPAAFKGHYIKSVTLSSSMSPGVKLASAEYNKF